MEDSLACETITVIIVIIVDITIIILLLLIAFLNKFSKIVL